MRDNETFEENLKRGLRVESDVGRYLLYRGWSFLSIHKDPCSSFGPRIMTPDGELISPDVLAMRDGTIRFIEVKDKTTASWHRKTGRWVTGIDIHSFEHYVKVALACLPVWLFFFQRHPVVDVFANTPSPTGLYCGNVLHLLDCENHRHSAHGRTGMVYWDIESLIKVATVQQVADALHG